MWFSIQHYDREQARTTSNMFRESPINFNKVLIGSAVWWTSFPGPANRPLLSPSTWFALDSTRERICEYISVCNGLPCLAYDMISCHD